MSNTGLICNTEIGTRIFYRENGMWYGTLSEANKNALRAETLREVQMGRMSPREASYRISSLDRTNRTCCGPRPMSTATWAGFILNGEITLYPGPLGWLSPEGKLFPAPAYQHDALADILHPKGTVGLDEAGWARLTSTGPIWAPEHDATEAQAGYLLQENV